MVETGTELNQEVFRASTGPVLNYIVGALSSALAFLLLAGFSVFLAKSSMLGKESLLWVVLVTCACALVFGIICAIFFYRYQYSIALDDDGIQINRRPEPVTIRWDQIAEIHRDKSFFGSFQPATRAGKRKMQKKSWKDKTTGVRLSLIAQSGTSLARLHSSNFKEFKTIVNLIESKTIQAQHGPTRDFEKEKRRALKKFRRGAFIYVALSLLSLSIPLGYFELARQEELNDKHIKETGTVVQGSVIEKEGLNNKAIFVQYEFIDSNNQTHSDTKRLKHEEWEKRSTHDNSIEIIYDPANPKHNRPTKFPIDLVLINEPMRIMSYYILPAIFLPCLLISMYQLFTNNIHYETDRYTIVKIGKENRHLY